MTAGGVATSGLPPASTPASAPAPARAWALGRLGARRPSWDRLAEAVSLLVAALAVGWAFGGLFVGHGAWAPLAGAVLVPAGLTAAAGRLTRRLDLLASVMLTGLAGYLVVVVFGWADGRAVGSLPNTVNGLRRGWSNLLTAGLPGDPTATLLVVPVLVLWLATAAAVALAALGGAMLAPLLPLGAAFAVAVALLGGAERRATAAGAVLALASLGFALARAHRRGGVGASPAGSFGLGLPVVLVAVLVGAAVAAALPSDDRADPRTLRPRPVTSVAELDPLAQVRGQLTASPPRRLGTVTLASSTGRLPVDRVTTAVLGDFDGASWRNHDAYLSAGTTLPRDADADGGLAADGPTVTVHAHVTIDRLDTPLLPVVGRPIRLSGVPAAFDPWTGTLVHTAAASSYQYQLTATIPTPGAGRLADAVPGSGPDLARYRTIPPGLPPALVQVAARATAGARTAYAELTALQRFLRDPAAFPYDLAGRPGHSYGSLSRLLTSDDPRERHSYAEQHAAAFALLARVKGFPSRIAVGYLLGPDTAGGRGVFTLSQARAHAWPEVYLAGIGWTPFEPTDTSRLSHEEPPDTASTAAGGMANAPTPTPPSPPSPPKLSAIPRLDQPHSGAGHQARQLAVAVLVALAALLAIVPLAVVGEKARRRRRRRRAGPPGQRVAAAWQEARDRLSEWGVPPVRSRSASEVVGDATVLGPQVIEPLGLLEPLLSRALYGRQDAAEADAARAWELGDLLRRRLREQGSWLRRLRAALDPRALLGARATRGGAASGAASSAARGPGGADRTPGGRLRAAAGSSGG
ncbi:transglutaminase-like domain-containing protein [Frankia tisae]|uniref:transglutaminase-like domain-containing protein n=1 Tax=Frankia tisae TaxID=2950104 RepID=UPI0021C1D984|nr:transglutaminase-like domain-containing protein [Frankia tisae]